MQDRRDPINPTDDEARALARRLLDEARTGALAVRDPDTGAPYVSRVAVAPEGAGLLVLVSNLAHHTRGLLGDPACSILVGEPGAKGDPLTHPRLTLIATAQDVAKQPRRDAWLSRQPKAALYYDFADFRMFHLAPLQAHLNGGFARAFRLTAADLEPPA